MIERSSDKEEVKGVPSTEYISPGHRACAGCGEILTLRTILKGFGEKVMVVSATGCMEVVTTPYPYTAWNVPWMHGAFENAPALASGLDYALQARGERDDVDIVVFGGDGASFDIGFQAISGAAERGHKIIYVATDNEGYMNTGIQRSAATPPFASTTNSPAGKKIHGKTGPKKPLPFIMAAHGLKYVATVSIANTFDLLNKVRKARQNNSFSFIHALSPCPLGWRMSSGDTLEAARLAVETCVFPLYEIENGVLKITQPVDNPKPVEEYLKLQGRFKHMTSEDIEQMQKYVLDRWNFIKSIEGKKVFDVLY